MTDQPTKFERQDVIGPLAVALLALLSVVLTLDAAGDYPKLFEGPGITLDESFNVQMGVYQWNAIRAYNIALLHPDSVREVFGPESNYNPDHPPLGRVWLGLCHDLTRWLFPPADHPSPFVTDCARVGSATAFALTVFLIGLFASRWYGRAAGIVASVSLVLMPRVFAHAHLASLETFMNLTYSATILAVAHWWQVRSSGLSRSETRPPEGGTTNVSLRIAALTGVLFGLALLTKMQAILIPPVVGLWALWHWRVRAIKPLALFGLVGVLVFFVGWPWLWLDPAKHFHGYFARTTNRAVLNCYYFGQVWADKDVPWHYPFVMFAVTVPVGLHALGLLGAVTKLTRNVSVGLPTSAPRSRFGLVCEPREQLLLAAMLLPLVLFALPGVAVYDGERLFLVSYPMWAVLIGRGTQVVWGYWCRKAESPNWEFVSNNRNRTVILVLWLLTQSVGVIAMHPCQLSYYNMIVGGLRGAERLGFERTYWGDSLTRHALEILANGTGRGGVVVVEPVLHQFQLRELLDQSPILRQKELRLLTAQEVGEIADLKLWRQIVICRRADISRERCDFGYGEKGRSNIAIVHRSDVLLTNTWEESLYFKPSAPP